MSTLARAAVRYDDGILARRFSWGDRAELRLSEAEPAHPLASLPALPAPQSARRPPVLVLGHEAEIDDGVLDAAFTALADAGYRPPQIWCDPEQLTPERAARFKAAEVPVVYLELHAPAAAPHEFLTRRRGSFAATLQAAVAAAKTELPVAAAVAITRPGHRLLPQLSALLVRLGVRRAELFLPWALEDDPTLMVSQLVPRVSLVAGDVDRAIDLLRRAGRETALRGIPYCNATGQEAALEHGRREDAVLDARCGPCRWKPWCHGIAPGYLSTYDAGELVPETVQGRADELDLHEPQLPLHLMGSGLSRGIGAAKSTTQEEEIAALKRIIDAKDKRLELHLRDEAGDVGYESLAATLKLGRKAGARRLRIAGPDPIAHPALGELLTVARLSRYVDIEVLTTAQRFATPRDAFKIVEAGMWRMSLTFCGPDASTHDAVLETPGAFERAVSCMRGLRERGFDNIGAHYQVTESNYAGLLDFVGFARDNDLLPVDGVLVEAGAARLSDALEAVRSRAPHVREEDVSETLRLWAPHAPECLIDAFFPGRGQIAAAQAAPLYGQLDDRDCPHRAACAAGERCPGYSEDYRARYGPDEFRPVASDSAAEPSRERA